MGATDDQDPLPFRGVESLDVDVEDADGHSTTAATLVADPESEWHGDDRWPDEPHPPAGRKLSERERYAWMEAKLAFWRSMMRAPYQTKRRRRGPRRLGVRDLNRGAQAAGRQLICERCGDAFVRAGTRGPEPRFCSACRTKSRNANA